MMNLIKKYWRYTILILLLVVSLGFNLSYYHTKNRVTKFLISQYEEQLERAEDSLNDSLRSDSDNKQREYIITTYESLERAHQIGSIIIAFAYEHSPDDDIKVYLRVPSKMRYILSQADYSNSREENLQQVSKIFQTYNNDINIDILTSPYHYSNMYYAYLDNLNLSVK